MTTGPKLKISDNIWQGVVALALFVVMAAVFIRSPFGASAGFAGEGSITSSIGYAMFNIGGAAVPSEAFLVTFEIIDVVLVAALVAAVMLAKREDEGIGQIMTPLTDGGREIDDEEEGGED